MLVDVGRLRFTVPDEARDGSTYLFRRGETEQVSIELENMPTSMTVQSLYSQRIALMESFLGHSVPTAPHADRDAEGAMGPAVRELDLSELEMFMGMLLGRLDSSSGLIVRYACRAESPRDRLFFRELVGTVSARAVPKMVMPPGWMELDVLGVGLGLPADFMPSVGYYYSTAEWMLRVEQREPVANWTPYFSASDELRVVERNERPIALGPHVTGNETISRVARHRARLVVNGSERIAELVEEHVLREAVVSSSIGPLNLFGGALTSRASTLERVWRQLCASLESSAP